MAKKKYPSAGRLQNYPLVTVLSYFIFQGMRYMTLGERAYKLALTVILAFWLFRLGAHPLVAILVGHGVNFVLNGQIPVLMRYVASDIGLTRSKALKSIDKMLYTAGKFGVVDILIFGSFCRHSMKSTSDLDLRFFHRPDLRSALAAYIYATYIRIWANFNYIPIDVYCFSEPAFLDRMRSDENPALLFFSKEMRQKYPSAQKPTDALNCNEGLS